MLKNIALTLFAVVIGMSWIILVKDKEIEYTTKATYIELDHFLHEDEDRFDDIKNEDTIYF